MSNRTIAILIGFLSLAAASPVAARSIEVRFLSVGGIADAPVGFTEMCQRDGTFCGSTEPSAGIVSASPVEPLLTPVKSDEMLRQLKRVNRWVNGNVFQVSDRVSSGVDELWQRPDFTRMPKGDCEDIALEKFARLADEGFPVDRMFFAVAFTRAFGLHTVLIVRLEDGDYVLDSRTAKIKAWNKVRYSWLRVQSPVDRQEWRRIGPPVQTVALANREALTSATPTS